MKTTVAWLAQYPTMSVQNPRGWTKEQWDRRESERINHAEFVMRMQNSDTMETIKNINPLAAPGESEQVESTSPWRPFTEIPPFNESLLFLGRDGYVYFGELKRIDKDGHVFESNGDEVKGFSFWMPIPELPTKP